MRLWRTEVRALDAQTGEMETWCGDIVEAPSFELAQEWCNNNKGYLKVVGELVAEIPCKKGTCEADWSRKVDYENISNT